MDPENLDEFGAAVFSVWYTQNPLGCPDREYICNFDTEEEPVIFDKTSAVETYGNLHLRGTPHSEVGTREKKGVLFTAHVHPSEPLWPSPDDFLIYSRLEQKKDLISSSAENQLVNFIIDGYICRRADKNEK